MLRRKKQYKNTFIQRLFKNFAKSGRIPHGSIIRIQVEFPHDEIRRGYRSIGQRNF